MAMEDVNKTNNPWLGLKTYEEGQILYGRTDDVNTLSQNILFNIQTVIYGKSGIGKSSILNAGVFPILRRSNFFPVNIRLIHNQPERSYNSQIWECVINSLYHLRKERLTSEGKKETLKDIRGRYEELAPASEKESLWEMFHRNVFYDDADVRIQPVLVFDQFEEIFTREQNQNKVSEFFNELADLINNVVPAYLCKEDKKDVGEIAENLLSNDDVLLDEDYDAVFADYLMESNFHIVLSLREDFLSYLERNITNIPLLKHNRYCLKPLNEEQAASVIMEPAPGLVTEEVAKEIISRVTGVPITDFELGDEPELEVDSAILSLFLSELFERKPVENRIIDKSLVVELGDNIIQEFYERTMSHISVECAEYLEYKLITEDGRRDSVFESHITQRKGYKISDLNYLKEQRLIREFPWNDGIRIEFIHDVLCPIIVRRRDERRKRKQIEAEQKELELLRREEIRLAKEQTERLRARNRQLLLGLIGTIITIALFAFIYWDGMYREVTTRYGEVIKKHGWMIGIEPLTEIEASHRTAHYLFIRKGRWSKHAYRVEARDGYGNLTTNHSMSAYILNQFDDSDEGADATMKNKMKTVCQWELVADRTGDFMLQERAMDENRNLVFCYNRSRYSVDDRIVSTYSDDSGFPIMLRDSCYFYMLTTLNEKGEEVLMEFYNDKGLPITNKDSAYQTRWTYFPNGSKKSEESLFLNGYRMIDRVGNCGWEVLSLTDDGYHEAITIFFDRDRKPCRVFDDETMVRQYEYDEYGRVIKQTFWKVENEDYDVDDQKILLEMGWAELLPDTNYVGLHGYLCEYNEYGQRTLLCGIDVDGNTCKGSINDWVKIKCDFDRNGNLVSEIALDEQDMIYFVHKANYTDEGKCLLEQRYNITDDGDTIMDYNMWWDDELKKKVVYDYYHYDDFYIHEEYDEKDNQTLQAYYTITENKPDCDSDGLHKIIWNYQYYGNDSTIITQCNYDVLNRPCGFRGYCSWWKEVSKVDSIGHVKTSIQLTTDNVYKLGYDDDATPRDSFYMGSERKFDRQFKIAQGEISIDSLGVRCRTYKNGAYYYEAKFIRSILPSLKEKNYGHYALNEFGEPSLIRDYDFTYSTKYQNVYYNEYGELIDGNDENQPILAAIEASPTLGFQTNDILVQQDDWVMWGDYRDSDPTEFVYGLEFEPSNAIPHLFKVLRFNEIKKDYDLVEINVPAGSSEIRTIEYYKFYCTKEEIKRVYSKLNDVLYPHMFEFVPTEGGPLYNAGVTSPVWVLGINEWNMNRHFNGEIDSIQKVVQYYRGEDKLVTLFDEEESQVIQCLIAEDSLGVNIESYRIRPRYFEEILEQMDEAIENQNQLIYSIE